jgi:hypothetical protein
MSIDPAIARMASFVNMVLTHVEATHHGIPVLPGTAVFHRNTSGASEVLTYEQAVAFRNAVARMMEVDHD